MLLSSVPRPTAFHLRAAKSPPRWEDPPVQPLSAEGLSSLRRAGGSRTIQREPGSAAAIPLLPPGYRRYITPNSIPRRGDEACSSRTGRRSRPVWQSFWQNLASQVSSLTSGVSSFQLDCTRKQNVVLEVDVAMQVSLESCQPLDKVCQTGFAIRAGIVVRQLS